MMVDRIDLDMVRDSPFKYYTDGNFYCSKAVVKTLKLSKEIHDYFKEEKGSLCCKVLTRKFKKFGSKEHKEQCALFTKELAYKTAEVIVRELNITVVKDGTEEVKIKKGPF